jgi:S-adenosylmethionine synthetase
MSKRKQKRPTTRELKRDIGVVVKEVVTLKSYVNEVLTPFVKTNMNLLEKYLEHKGEVDDFVSYLEKDVNNEKETVNKSTEKRPEKQTKRSGATKTDSKNGKRSRAGSVQ